MKRFIDWTMWLMFFVTFIISLLTMIVAFGIQYTGLELFATLLPLEISLGGALVLWGLNSFLNPYLRHGKSSIFILSLLGVILLAFARYGVY
jgi:hypothetical protein